MKASLPARNGIVIGATFLNALGILCVLVLLHPRGGVDDFVPYIRFGEWLLGDRAQYLKGIQFVILGLSGITALVPLVIANIDPWQTMESYDRSMNKGFMLLGSMVATIFLCGHLYVYAYKGAIYGDWFGYDVGVYLLLAVKSFDAIVVATSFRPADRPHDRNSYFPA